MDKFLIAICLLGWRSDFCCKPLEIERDLVERDTILDLVTECQSYSL
jgi:hypothetical protein